MMVVVLVVVRVEVKSRVNRVTLTWTNFAISVVKNVVEVEVVVVVKVVKASKMMIVDWFLWNFWFLIVIVVEVLVVMKVVNQVEVDDRPLVSCVV